MAGKAKQMTAVVDELMDRHARENRGGALFNPDKVDHEEQENAPEQGQSKRKQNCQQSCSFHDTIPRMLDNWPTILIV